MFTGIITDVGRIVSVQPKAEGEKLFRISAGFNTQEVAIGASICCSGICLTVTAKGTLGAERPREARGGGSGEESATNNKPEPRFWFEALASKETLGITNANSWEEGTRINLERSLKVGDELGGHIVSGHVDGVAEVLEFKKSGESGFLRVKTPAELARYIARKGSVTLDGISLTVNSVEERDFSVNIIPHTYENTSLKLRKSGDLLNLEVDLFARYIERMIEK